MTILFSVLWMTDLLMFLVAVESTLSNGVGGMVLFASEVLPIAFYSTCTANSDDLVWDPYGERVQYYRKIYSVSL